VVGILVVLENVLDVDGPLLTGRESIRESLCAELPVEIVIEFQVTGNRMLSTIPYVDTGGGFYQVPDDDLVDQIIKFHFDAGGTGNALSVVMDNTWAYLAMPRFGNAYYYFPYAFSFSLATKYTIRMRMETLTTTARIWPSAEAEPTGVWHLSRTLSASQIYFDDHVVGAEVRATVETGGSASAFTVIVHRFTVGKCVSYPVTGQTVVDELVDVGDGTTITFTTDYPFRPGSLQIKVDGLWQLVASYTASTGSFTLSFTPASGERIYATYEVA